MKLFARWSAPILGFVTAVPGFAHEGEEHGIPTAGSITASTKHTMTAVSDRFELVVKNRPLQAGHPEVLELYVSDFATNAPVGEAKVDVRLQSKLDGRQIWSGTAAAANAPGVYSAAIALADTGAFVTVVSIDQAGRIDEFALAGLEVLGMDAPPSGRDQGLRGVAWRIGLGAGLLLVGVVAVMRWRRRGSPALLVAGLLCIHVQRADGHEGHDEAPVASGEIVGAGSVVYMPKETQFLLGVLTAPVKSENVQKYLRVAGRVAPRSGGELEIVAPQAGRIHFPRGRTPALGERVANGQVIATLVVIDSLVLRSALGGIVTEVPLVNAQLVSAGQTILRVLDPSVVRVHADVYERDVASVEKSTRARVFSASYPDDVLIGRRITFGAALGEVPGTVEVWFEVPNPHDRLKIDMLVDVEIEQGESTPALVVPRAALIEREGRSLVFVHVAPEQFAAREVEPTANLGSSVAVRGSLQPKDRVVVAGSYQLFGSPTVSAPR